MQVCKRAARTSDTKPTRDGDRHNHRHGQRERRGHGARCSARSSAENAATSEGSVPSHTSARVGRGSSSCGFIVFWFVLIFLVFFVFLAFLVFLLVISASLFGLFFLWLFGCFWLFSVGLWFFSVFCHDFVKNIINYYKIYFLSFLTFNIFY